MNNWLEVGSWLAGVLAFLFVVFVEWPKFKARWNESRHAINSKLIQMKALL